MMFCHKISSILKTSYKKITEKIIYFFSKDKLRFNVLERYIVKELVLYFSVAFLFFFTIFFVNQILLLAESILRQGAPVWDVIKLMTYSLPFIIAQSAPFATLVGFLMCLGRFMSDNEIIIFRASGCSYTYVLKPVLILGIVISLISFFVNDYLLPLGTINFNKLRRDILSSNPTIELESNTVKYLNNSTLVIGTVNDTTVSDLVIIDRGDDGKERIITAGKSELMTSKKTGVLMNLNMTDALALFFNAGRFENYDVLSSKQVSLNIFDSSFFDYDMGVSPREMTSYDLGKALQKMRKENTTDEYTLNNYSLEFNKKFSLPFGSFFFALLALPLAFLFGRHNGQTIGMIIGIVISFFYWAIMILGQYASSRNGFSGFWSMWIPNFLIGGAGVIFYVALKKK